MSLRQYVSVLHRPGREKTDVDPSATLDDAREAFTTIEEIYPTARRVLGGAHPTTEGIEDALRYARAALAAREGDGVSSVCEAVAAAKLRTA